MITPELIGKIMPGASPEHVVKYAPWLDAGAREFGITSPLAVAAFLATVAEETGELESVSENLNYSANGLANTWPNRYAERNERGEYVRAGGRFVPNTLAQRLHRNPEAIANHCYADRMGNGDEASGDGWRFRGAGGIQETGKDNHYGAALAFDVELDRIGDWLRSPEGAMRSAARGFAIRGCIERAEAGDFDGVCDLVNLGRKTRAVGDANGYARRLAFFNAARKALT